MNAQQQKFILTVQSVENHSKQEHEGGICEGAVYDAILCFSTYINFGRQMSFVLSNFNCILDFIQTFAPICNSLDTRSSLGLFCFQSSSSHAFLFFPVLIIDDDPRSDIQCRPSNTHCKKDSLYR